jgi:hypothetical protein
MVVVVAAVVQVVVVLPVTQEEVAEVGEGVITPLLSLNLGHLERMNPMRRLFRMESLPSGVQNVPRLTMAGIFMVFGSMETRLTTLLITMSRMLLWSPLKKERKPRVSKASLVVPMAPHLLIPRLLSRLQALQLALATVSSVGSM